MKLFNRLTSLVLLVAIIVSGYMMYNFHPGRDIAGYKTFFERDTYNVHVGKRMRRNPKLGEYVLLYQDEQSMRGEVIDVDEFTIDDNGVYMSMIDEDAVIYEDLFNFNAVIVGGGIGLIMIADIIYSNVKRKKKEE